MTEKRTDDKPLEDLLRSALADDLPADVAAGMRARIDRFRAENLAGAATAAPSGAWALFLRRGVWATLSLLMLVAGLLLQGAKASSPLADRISAIKAEIASLETTRR